MSVELNSVVQEVIVDDSKAVSGSARVVDAMENMAVAADKATAANVRQASGFSALDAALKTSAPAQESALRRLNAWKAQADPVEAALQRLSRAEQDVNRAISQGLSDQAQKAQIMDALWKKTLGAAEAQEKLNASQRAQAAQGAFNSQLGVRDDFNGAARAADIEAYGRSLDQLQTKFDPVYRAQQMVAQETEELTRAQQTGAISQETYAVSMARVQANAAGVEKAIETYTAEIQQAKAALDAGSISQGRYADQLAAANTRLATASDQFVSRSTRGQNSARQMGVAIQQAGYQVGDFAVQVASGQGVLRPFIQQGTQLVSMFGPMGAVIGAAGAIVGAFATYLMGASKAADLTKGSYETLTDAVAAFNEQTSRSIDLGKQETTVLIEKARAITIQARAELGSLQSTLARRQDEIAQRERQLALTNAGGAVAGSNPLGEKFGAELDASRKAASDLADKINEVGGALDTSEGDIKAYQKHLDGLVDSYHSQINANNALIAAATVSRHEYDVTAKTQEILASKFDGTTDQARALAETLVTQKEQLDKLTGSTANNTKELERRAKAANDNIKSLNVQAAQQAIVATSYGISTEAGREAELQMKARIATVGLGKKVEEDYLAALKKVEVQERAAAAAQALRNEQAKTAIAQDKARAAQISDPNQRHQAELAIAHQTRLNELTELYGSDIAKINAQLGEFDSQQAYDEQARFWNDVRDKAQAISGDISQFLIDGFVNAGNGGKSMFKNLWDGALQGAKRMIANIAAEFLKTQFIMPVVTSIVGSNAAAFGIAQPGGVAGAAGGLSSLSSLSSLGSLFTASGTLGTSLATSGFGQMLGLSTAGITPTGIGFQMSGLGSSVSGALNSLSSFGGMAGSLGGNFLANALLGDRGTGASVGGMLGAVAGSFIPIPVLGPMIGSFLGNAIGGLFGNNKPSDMFAQTDINLSKGVLGATHTGRPDETSQQNMDASKALAQQFLAIQQQILLLTGGAGPQAAYAKVGSRDGIVVGVGTTGIGVNNRQGSNSATFGNSEEGAKQALDFMVQALAKQVTGVANSDIQKVLTRGGTSEEILSNLTLVKSILDATAEVANPLVVALKAVNDNFDTLDKQARDLGLSTDLLTKLEAVRQKQLTELNATASLGTYQSVSGALSQLNDWMTGQQLSDASSLNPLGRQSLAQSSFDDLLKAVNDNGDLSKVGALTSSASNLISIARQNYGSTAGFTSVESQVQQALSNLGLSFSSQESIGDQVSKAIALSTQTNTEKLEELKAEIVKMRLAFSLVAQKLAA